MENHMHILFPKQQRTKIGTHMHTLRIHPNSMTGTTRRTHDSRVPNGGGDCQIPKCKEMAEIPETASQLGLGQGPEDKGKTAP
mmetsp:Transcript_38421/g.63854  ORF Transcript_38421/g.63854 Transcript_38421/m.63854 type:complete len:83 (-) Transcript_38421:244-492(-)